MGKCISKSVAVDPPAEKPNKDDHQSAPAVDPVEAEKSTPAPAAAAAADDVAVSGKGSDRSLQQLFAKDQDEEHDEEETGQLKRIPEEDSSEEQEEDVHNQVAANKAADSNVLDTIAEDSSHTGSENAEVQTALSTAESGDVQKQELTVTDEEATAAKDLPAEQEKSQEERPSTPEISDSRSPAVSKENEKAVAAASEAADTTGPEQVEHVDLVAQDSDKFELVLNPQVSEKFEIDIARAEELGISACATGSDQVPEDKVPKGLDPPTSKEQLANKELSAEELPAEAPPPRDDCQNEKDDELVQRGDDMVQSKDESKGGDVQKSENNVGISADATTAGALEPESTMEERNEGEKVPVDVAEEQTHMESGETSKPALGDASESKELEAASSQGQEEFFEASEQIADPADSKKSATEQGPDEVKPPASEPKHG